MIQYPFPIAEDCFATRRSTRLESADTVQNSAVVGTRGCNQEKCAITQLWLESSGVRSTSFNPASTTPYPGRTEQRFCFAPDHDAVTVRWTLEKTALVTGARLQLYRRGDATPIWSRVLNQGEAQALALSRPWKGELDTATERFPDGLVTVENSPYKLEMVIDGPTEDERDIAWTVFDVLVHEIALSWGKDAQIPEQRADLRPGATTAKMYAKLNLDGNKTALEKDLLEREKRLLAELAKNSRQPDSRRGRDGLDVLLDFSAFDDALCAMDGEFEFANNRWGDGPMIPIMAQVTVRTVLGAGALVPKALGRARFIWEWRDNDDLTPKAHLESWLGPEGDRSNAVSPISRTYFERMFEKHRSDKFPRHAFNCPEAAGGKRGVERPGAARRVVPDWTGDESFPFDVESPLTRRDWASVSYAAAHADARDRDDLPVQTGILFQPSHIAGDRFRLTVYSVSGSDALDVDLENESFVDLEAAAPGVPQATTPWFTIWRKLNATIMSLPSFHAMRPTLAEAIRTRFRRELGFLIETEQKALPDLGDYRDAMVGKEIAGNSDLAGNEGRKALLLRSVPTKRTRSATSDYVYDTITPDGLPDDIGSLGQNGDLLLMEFQTATIPGDVNGQACEDWLKIRGQSSSALALILPRGLQRFPMRRLALSVDGKAFSANEQVTIDAKLSNSDHPGLLGNATLVGATGFRPFRVAVEVATDGRLGHREIEVQVDALGGFKRVLHYPEGDVRPTRQLNEVRTRQLAGVLEKIAAQSAGDAPVPVRVVGKSTGGRDGERARIVESFLKQANETPARKSIADLFNKDFVKGREELAKYWRHISREAIKAWAESEQADLATHHRVYFNLQRGFSRFDKNFVTGGIESDISNVRIGIASVSVPVLDGEAGRPTQKRWLKDVETVAVHEFGHALSLKHSSPRLMDSKDATGNYGDHLAHDACLMNYDADTRSFCALCILKKRGWDWRGGTLITADHGEARSREWIETCLAKMKQLIDGDPQNHAWRVRFAMFLLSLDEYVPAAAHDAKDKGKGRAPIIEARVDVQAAQAQMDRVLADILPTDPKRVWALRNYLFYLDKRSYYDKFQSETAKATTLANERVARASAAIQAAAQALRSDATKPYGDGFEGTDEKILEREGRSDLLDEKRQANAALTAAEKDQGQFSADSDARVTSKAQELVDELMRESGLPLDYDDIVTQDAKGRNVIKLASANVGLWKVDLKQVRSRRLP